MSETVIHLKKSKRFLDDHLQEIKTAMRACTPAALCQHHLRQLRTRKIETCKKELKINFSKNGHVVGMYWENAAHLRLIKDKIGCESGSARENKKTEVICW